MSVAAMDVAVIGGGIAGVSAASAIAQAHSVVLLEQEKELGFHTTSRSAAIYIENEGGPVFHRLSTASRSFFESVHLELDAPLLDPLPVMRVGNEENHDAFAAEAAAAKRVTSSIRLVDRAELIELCPVLHCALKGLCQWW